MPTSPSVSSKNDLVSGIRRTLSKHHMLRSGDDVLVAASGGPDSTALLHALIQIARGRPMRLAVAHLHHGLRGTEADRDAAFVSEQAAQLGIESFVGREDAGDFQRRHRLSPEEAARQVRHRFLTRIAARHGFSRIALGHHAEDNAELVLIFLLRGAGPRGISGIPPVRGPMIRPMIECRKDQIRKFLEAHRIPFVTDTSNADRRFLRNRIRHELIPLLQSEYNPGLTETLLRLADVARAEDRWLDRLSEAMFSEVRIDGEGGRIRLAIPRLAKLPEAACRRVIRRALSGIKGDLRRISFDHVAAVAGLPAAESASAEVHLPDGVRVRREYDRLVFERRPVGAGREKGGPAAAAAFCRRIPGPGRISLPEAGVEIRLEVCPPPEPEVLRRSGQHVAFFDMHKICFPLTVRNVRPGDRFHPMGMAGTQKVQDFFTNRKTPRPERRRSAVLVSRESIVWLVGHRIDETVKVTSGTRKVLRGEVTLAEPA